MTGGAGWKILVGIAFLKYFFSLRHEILRAVARGRCFEGAKVFGDGSLQIRADTVDHRHHEFSGNRIVAAVLGKSFELIFEILRLLPGKLRYRVRSVISPARRPMAHGAILNLGL